MIAACKVFERIRQWLGRASAGDKQVHVVTDEHRTIQKIVPEFGFDWSLDTFHREKKLESDWYKHCEVQDKNGRRTNLGMAEKHLLGKMIRNYFRAIMSGRKEDRLAKWEAIPRNLAPETHEDGVEAIKTFVEGYRKFVQATERVDFASTSYNESLHSHNLRFTSKNIFQSRIFATKMKCSVLSWNQRPRWQREVYNIFKRLVSNPERYKVKKQLEF